MVDQTIRDCTIGQFSIFHGKGAMKLGFQAIDVLSQALLLFVRAPYHLSIFLAVSTNPMQFGYALSCFLNLISKLVIFRVLNRDDIDVLATRTQ
jgi:hypothetical protein